MISYLKGEILEIKNNYLVILVNDVGYKVFAPLSILSQIRQGDKTELSIYTHVREDTLELYGFNKSDDLRLFEMIIGVSGIGCKTAIGIYDKGTSSQIIDAILKSDTGFFTGVPRLGKKNAQKLIIELRSKLGESQTDLSGVMNEEGLEIESALKSMGYSQKEASLASSYALSRSDNTEQRLKIALKYLAK